MMLTFLQRIAFVVLGVMLLSARRSADTKLETLTTTVLQLLGVAALFAAIVGKLP